MINFVVGIVVVLMYAIHAEAGICPYGGMVCGWVMGLNTGKEELYYCSAKCAVPVLNKTCANLGGITLEYCVRQRPNDICQFGGSRSCEELKVQIQCPIPSCSNGGGDCPYEGEVCGWVLGTGYSFNRLHTCSAKCAIPIKSSDCSYTCCNRNQTARSTCGPRYDYCAPISSPCFKRSCNDLKSEAPCKNCCFK